VLSRLQARLAEVQATEYAARWEADFEEVQNKRDELAQQYAANLSQTRGQLVDLFCRIEAADKDVARLGGNGFIIAAKQATSVIPIVFAAAGDPVGSGLVALHDRTATSPACRFRPPISLASGSNFYARSSPVWVAWQS
jgi:hypothetical protein